MALYLVDGDNNPCIGTKGAEWLAETDRVTVFYNNSNAYYKLEQNRIKFAESTKAEVSFEVIPCSKNSVDFAVAVKAGFYASRNAAEKIFLVSEDAHFALIAELIRSEIGKGTPVVHVTSIWKGVLSDEANLTDLVMIYEVLQSTLGQHEGNVVYSKMKKLMKAKMRDKFEQEMVKKEQAREKMMEHQQLQKPQTGSFKRLILSLAGTNI